MANTITEYTGDGATTDYTIGFSYIDKNYVSVYQNNTLMLRPSEWTFKNASTIQFKIAPGSGDDIKIKRSTEDTDRLVVFQNGAVLTESDLNLAVRQNFNLIQEIRDSLVDLAGGALGNVSESVLDGIAEEILSKEVADEVQQRISDIDNNAQSILDNITLINDETNTRINEDLDLQSQINALAESAVAEAYVQDTEPVPGTGGVPAVIPDNARWYDSDDNNHPYIWLPDDLTDGSYQWTATGNTGEFYLEASGGGDPGFTEPQQVEENDSYLAKGTPPLAAGEWAWGDGGGGFNTVIVRLSDDADPDSKASGFVEWYGWRDLRDPRIGQNEADISALDVRVTDAEGDIVTNASAISTLDTTVTNHGNTLTSHSTRLDSLESTVNDPITGVSANANAISQLETDVSAAEGDIVANATDISNLQSTVNDPSTGVDANATAISALDSRVTVNEGDIAAQATDITALQSTVNDPDTGVDANASAISVLDTRVTSNDGDISAQASQITSLETEVDGNTASITTLQSSVNGLEARYGVQLNVNGYVTGFEQFNDADSGTFQILADKFYVVDPGNGGQNPQVVFGIDNGNVALQNLVVNGSLLVNDSVSFQKLSINQLSAITANIGQLTINSGGYIAVGKTSASDTTNGLYLGHDGGSSYDLHIGDSTRYVWWNGSAGTLSINGDVHGDINFDNALISLDDSGAIFAYDTQSVTETNSVSYQVARTVHPKGSGSVSVRVQANREGVPYDTPPQIRVVRNGSTVVGSAQSLTSTTGEKSWTGISISDGDYLEIQMVAGTRSSGDGIVNAILNWTQLRAVVDHAKWS